MKVTINKILLALFSVGILSLFLIFSYKDISENEIKSNKKQIDKGEDVHYNISNNIVLGGELAEENGQLFFSNANDNWKLYKQNVTGDAEPHKIADFKCNNLNLAGGRIYCNDGQNHRIVKMKLDGSEEQTVYKGIVENLIYCSGVLFFIEEDGDKQSIIKIKGDGKEKEKIYTGSICNMIVTEKWIYFYCEQEEMIKRVSKDGSSVSDIYKADVDQFIMDGSDIYFADKDKQKICRIDCEGKGFSFVDNNCPDYMNVFGRDIYYWHIKDDVWKSGIGEKGEKIAEVETLRFYITDHAMLYDYVVGKGFDERICQKMVILQNK